MCDSRIFSYVCLYVLFVFPLSYLTIQKAWITVTDDVKNMYKTPVVATAECNEVVCVSLPEKLSCNPPSFSLLTCPCMGRRTLSRSSITIKLKLGLCYWPVLPWFNREIVSREDVYAIGDNAGFGRDAAA